MQLDELIEGLEAELGSAEIFTALFELELRGQGEAVAGKELCAVLLMDALVLWQRAMRERAGVRLRIARVSEGYC